MKGRRGWPLFASLDAICPACRHGFPVALYRRRPQRDHGLTIASAPWSIRSPRRVGCRLSLASGVPETRRALPSACPRRPAPGADRSGRLALIAWFDMTYLGGDSSRSGPCHRHRISPAAGGPGATEAPESVREEAGQPPGSRRRAGGGSFGVARWLRRDHPGPGLGRSSRGVVLVPLGGHQIGQAQARSLRRSVFRVIPRSRAAWSLLPSVDPSTSGRRSRSRCWCASW